MLRIVLSFSSTRFHSLHRNGLSYYRAQQVKLKATDVYWKRAPEDICRGEERRKSEGEGERKTFLLLQITRHG